MRLRMLAAVTAAALTTFAATTGCETEIVIDDGTSSGSTTGSSTGTGASGSTSSGGVCDGFFDEDGAGAVTITVRNQSPLPVFLPANCSGQPVFQITPTGGPDGNTYAYEPSCLQTCADLKTEPQYACGACAPASIRIGPGEARSFTWDGTALTAPTSMPAACWFEPHDGTCVERVAAPAQAYAFNVDGFAGCGAPGEACSCTSDGQCSGDPSGQQAYATPTKISFPQANQVEILFDICAFGCAEPF